jgi:hypothetical protein
VTRTVLIVEDEQSIRDILTELFDADGTSVITAATLADAQTALAQQEYHLIVTDLRLGRQADGGLQVMAASGLLSPDATVIVLTAFPTTTCATPRSGSAPRTSSRSRSTCRPSPPSPPRRRGDGDAPRAPVRRVAAPRAVSPAGPSTGPECPYSLGRVRDGGVVPGGGGAI